MNLKINVDYAFYHYETARVFSVKQVHAGDVIFSYYECYNGRNEILLLDIDFSSLILLGEI